MTPSHLALSGGGAPLGAIALLAAFPAPAAPITVSSTLALAKSISIAGTRTQLKIGKSFSVYRLISVSLNCCTKSRKSSGKFVSNATTNS